MLVQFENPALIKPQSFPNGIAALDGGIERADAGFVPTNKLTVDVDDQMAVSFVEFLQHEMAKNELGKQEPRKKNSISETCGLSSFPAFLITPPLTPFKSRAPDRGVATALWRRAGCAPTERGDYK